MVGSKDGSVDVSVERRLVGEEVGNWDGKSLIFVGNVDDDAVGFLVGWKDGSEVGNDDDGGEVINTDGWQDDADEGDLVRFNDGKVDGVSDEINEGSTVGFVKGMIDGS